MIRQLLIAIVLGLALSGCGVGYDEDPASLGVESQRLELGVNATQDPVPPKTEPATIAVIFDRFGNPVSITASSGTPGNPGDQNSSSQDPIPPKNGLVASGRPIPGDNPNEHIERIH
jgi:hypothetical protein